MQNNLKLYRHKSGLARKHSTNAEHSFLHTQSQLYNSPITAAHPRIHEMYEDNFIISNAGLAL